MELAMISNFHHREGLMEGSNLGPFDPQDQRAYHSATDPVNFIEKYKSLL